MIGIDINEVDKKRNLEQVLCELEYKINELVKQYNLVITNQVELKTMQIELKKEMDTLNMMQLTFLDGVVLKAPNDKRFLVKVTNEGTLTTEEKVM